MRLLEVEARTYLSKQYRDYLKSQEEDLPEGDEWKREIEDMTPQVPKPYLARILVNPLKFISAIESYSVEAMAQNPDQPEFDGVEICLEDGLQINITGSLEDFQKKWDEHHASPTKKK